MKKSELEKFRLRLLDEKNRVLGQLERVESNIEQPSGDFLEIVAQLERQRNLQQTLTEITNALGRIENGTYGLSEVSGRPIPVRRLEALPWATRLVEEAIEQPVPTRTILKPFTR